MTQQNVLAAILSGRQGISLGLRNIVTVYNPTAKSVDYGTTVAQLALPATVMVQLSDNTLTPIPLTWNTAIWNPTTPGVYNFVGTFTMPLPPGITNSTGKTASYQITLLAAVTAQVFLAPSPAGNDSNSGLTSLVPKATLQAAINLAVSLGGAKTISATAGTWILPARINWPINVSFAGAGKDVTIIKGDESLNHTYVPGTYAYAWDKALIRFETGSTVNGNQTLRDFTLDCSKITSSNTRGQHVGLYTINRDNITFKGIKCRKSGFVGFHSYNTTNQRITECDFIDCSYGESAFATGCVTWGRCFNLEIDHCTVNEGFGNGMKAFTGTGPADDPSFLVYDFKFHDNYISVVPNGQWNNGNAPNIAVENWGAVVRNAHIYNNYIDNTISLVKNFPPQDGITTFKVYNNVMDMITRANNAGYCLELSLFYVEVYNNYMIGGAHATIANWQGTTYPAYGNWNIHHNTIRVAQTYYPSGVLRSENKGLNNVNLDNNTIHILPGQNQKVQCFVTYNTGSSTNLTFRNNIVIDESTANSQWGENVLAQINGSVQNFIISHNYMYGMPVGNVAGATYGPNFTANPQLTRSGVAPDPFYRPLPGSPVIAAGLNIGLPFTGAAPTIGAYEIAAPVQTGNVDHVETIPARSINTGVAWATLNATLPITARATLDNTNEVDIGITWAQGTYNPAVQDTYILTGTFKTPLPSGITNTLNKTASIVITVIQATVEFTDSFDRISLGANYVTLGNVTAVLDGNDMTMSVNGVATSADRIQRVSWNNTIKSFKSSVIFTPSIVNSLSTGLGIGIQNAVNPNPNKGVFMLFDNSTLANAGRISIVTAAGDLNNTNFVSRITSSTAIPIIAGRRYLAELKMETVGADAKFTALVTDLVTDAFATTVYTEVGAGSQLYPRLQTLYQLGGTRIVEDWTVYNLDPITSTVLVNDIFDRTVLTPWSKVDYTGYQLTVVMNNPYVTIASGVYAPSRLIAYDIPLGMAMQSWRMTVDFRFKAGAGGGFLIGVKNQPVNPNVNRAFFTRVDQFATKLTTMVGTALVNDDQYSEVHVSSGSMSFPNDQDFRVIMERTYNGSGNAVYNARVFLISTPGTFITTTYTSVNAPEQALYDSTKWSLPVMGNTAQIRKVYIEKL